MRLYRCASDLLTRAPFVSSAFPSAPPERRRRDHARLVRRGVLEVGGEVRCHVEFERVPHGRVELVRRGRDLEALRGERRGQSVRTRFGLLGRVAKLCK